ncbi:SDR family oxidoreductase [Plantibacter sp. YIM 135249]|uniref:SDR family oxidoreductase n=1 Tax=Plantibacter sp. YIM 135249 TaxID=3423918 RepID=UPI003D34B105
MSRVVIAGGHGTIAQHLQRLLVEAGHEAVGIIRNPDHVADLVEIGSSPVVLDLESISADQLAIELRGADAVVFAAGAGPNSTAERKLTVDRDGAILLADAAELAGVPRYVLVSAMSADDFDPDSDDIFQVYLRAKAEADANVRARGIDWTIVRPGGLTNDPGTGLVEAAETLSRGSIPREDVAAVLLSLIETGAASQTQFSLIGGTTPIPEALAAL